MWSCVEEESRPVPPPPTAAIYEWAKPHAQLNNDSQISYREGRKGKNKT